MTSSYLLRKNFLITDKSLVTRRGYHENGLYGRDKTRVRENSIIHGKKKKKKKPALVV
jgi:hypothetical protein